MVCPKTFGQPSSLWGEVLPKDRVVDVTSSIEFDGLLHGYHSTLVTCSSNISFQAYFQVAQLQIQPIPEPHAYHSARLNAAVPSLRSGS